MTDWRTDSVNTSCLRAKFRSDLAHSDRKPWTEHKNIRRPKPLLTSQKLNRHAVTWQTTRDTLASYHSIVDDSSDHSTSFHERSSAQHAGFPVSKNLLCNWVWVERTPLNTKHYQSISEVQQLAAPYHSWTCAVFYTLQALALPRS